MIQGETEGVRTTRTKSVIESKSRLTEEFERSLVIIIYFDFCLRLVQSFF